MSRLETKYISNIILIRLYKLESYFGNLEDRKINNLYFDI